jgi:hypothetical protein
LNDSTMGLYKFSNFAGLNQSKSEGITYSAHWHVNTHFLSPSLSWLFPKCRLVNHHIWLYTVLFQSRWCWLNRNFCRLNNRSWW